MIKRQILIFILGVTTLFSISCGSVAVENAADISINFEGLKTDLKIKDAVCYKIGYVPENKSITYAVEFTNFDADLANKKFNDVKLSEGQTKLQILLSVREDNNPSKELRAVSYSNNPQWSDSVIKTLAFTYQNGKENLSDMYIKDSIGSLELTSVTPTEIKGKLDFKFKEQFIKGNFSAKRVEKAE